MKKATTILMFGLIALVPLGAQQMDPLQRHLFPPELVMQHQGALRLSVEQQDYIIAQVQQAQSQFTGFQWRLQREVESLSELLRQSSSDESQALEQLEKVLELEKQIKRTHMTLAVRIKNTLSEEQQEHLRRLRPPSNPRRTGPGQPAGEAPRSGPP